MGLLFLTVARVLESDATIVSAMWKSFKKTEDFPPGDITYKGALKTASMYWALKIWEGKTVRSNIPKELNVLYWIFTFADAGYLALETLSTGALPLTILTQAAGLSILYFIERWRPQKEDRSP